MIEYYELKVSDKPIKENDIEVTVVDEFDNPVLDKNGKPKITIKKETPKKRLNSIAHYAIQDTVSFLNKKYNLKLKNYALFGGDSESYINKYLKKVTSRVDFLNDNNDNAIETVFNTQIDYEGSKKYLTFDVNNLSKKWANSIFQIVEKEIHKSIDNGTIESITELQELDYICLSDDCLYEINKFINSELTAIFQEMKNAKIMINRGESFSSKLGLQPLNITKKSLDNGISM